MNKSEAIMAMVVDGDQVRLESWLEEFHILFVDTYFLTQDGTKVDINSYPMEGWELLKETKKKKKMWQLIVEHEEEILRRDKKHWHIPSKK